MDKSLCKIEVVHGTEEREFVVKDKDNIISSRFYILEMDKNKKYVLLRLKPRRFMADEELEELLTKIFMSFTRKGDFFKVNIITSEDINFIPFSRLGFTLEGVLQNNVYKNSETEDELIFGASSVTFKFRGNEKLLSLTGERIELRLSTPEDAEKYLKYQTDNREFLEEFEPVKEDRYYTLEGQREELKARFSQFLNGNTVSFGIFRDDLLLGKIRISNIILGSFRNANLGYSLHKDYLNQGYMSEAVGMVLEYCFNELDLHRVEASILVNNIASQKVLLNNRFIELGINRNYLAINGKWQDHKTFYLTKEDYVAKAE